MNLRSVSSSALLFLMVLTLLFSCKKDIDDTVIEKTTPGVPFAIPASSPVSGSITGMVVDETNTPVNGAMVTYGGVVKTSDARGLFSFDNVTLDKYISTVTINHPGYFKAFRSFSANTGRNYVNIKLIPKTLAGTVTSSTAGSVSLPNGTQINFQSNSIVVKSTGAAYTGSVKVFASYIDPTASDISSVVPGSFVGRDANSLYALQSTGMIAVDLESPAGEALQLANNLPATIKLPIPASLLTKAPATIDTWSLNDQGVWQKEGTATKTGNSYEMQVSHFSFWNCDVPANAIYLHMHIQDATGNAITNTLVSLTVPNNNTWWATAYGTTDGSGDVSGLVPGGLALTLDIYPDPYNCNTPVSSQTVGPFAVNSSITVTATIPSSQSLIINGTATDCSNQPLQNGTAIIFIGSTNYHYANIINGSYSDTIAVCSAANSISVMAIDNNTGAQTTSANIPVSGTTIIIPDLNVCAVQNAVFTFGNSQGVCGIGGISGTYTVGVPFSSSNIYSMWVNVTSPGAYAITSTSADGVSFSGSGVFTSIGQQLVQLTGTGTPVAAGNFTISVQSLGMACTMSLHIDGPPAVYTLGGPGPCGTNSQGVYSVGLPLNTSNFVQVTVNVSTAGSYAINTGNDINGMQFVDSGTFVNTGVQVIVLHGSGAPLAAGINTFTVQSTVAGQGCTFDVTAVNNGGQAVYTFGGAPGTCTGAVLSGQYTAGTPMNGQNSVTLQVNVITPGSYAIITSNTNGFGFEGGGVFTATGIQNVTISANGTPALSGTYTFSTSSAGAAGCIFIVPVN